MQGDDKAHNHNQEINEEFTSFSWGEMSKLLDQEMPQTPVPTKDRKFPFLFLFMLIGFFAGIATMYLLYDKNVPVTEPSNKEDIQTEEYASNSVIEESIQDTPITNAIAKEKATASASSSNSTKLLGGTTFNSVDNNMDKTNNAVELELKKMLASIPTTNNEQVVEDMTVVPENVIGKNAFDKAPEKEKSTDSINKIYSDISTLALLNNAIKPIMILPRDLDVKPKYTIEPIEIPSKRKWRWGFSAGLVSDYVDNLKGGKIGAIVEIPLGSVLRLETGLLYSYHGRNFEAGATDDNFFNVVGQAIDPGNITTVIQESDIPLAVSNRQFLNIPVVLVTRLNKKWQLNTGLNASYLINADISAYDYPDIELVSTDQYNELKSSYRDYALQKWDMAAVLGLGYFPREHIGIDINFNFGFIDSFNNDWFQRDVKDVNKNVQLSLKYYLNN